MMTASEFALLQRTSVVTLSICGIFKEVVTISAASIVFADKLTPINVSGLLVTIICIAAYNYMKIKSMRDEARMEAHLANADYQPVLTADGEANGDANGRAPASGRRRSSTGQLSWNSLNTSITPPTDARDASSRQSPVKRPEDLE